MGIYNNAAAVAAVEFHSISEIPSVSLADKNADAMQVQYICDVFEKAIKTDDPNRTGVEPLLIKRSGVRFSTGYGDLIEIHGYFTKDIAESAAFALQDSGKLQKWSPDTMVEYVTNDEGYIIAIRFMRPMIRVRF